MKRVHRIGLVTAGKITGLWIERTVELKRHVGPVYSTSLRLASRAAHTLLRTGFHTTDWEELRRCDAVLFFLPPDSLRAMTSEWMERGLDLRGLRLVVCDDLLTLADLAELRELGALTAAIGPMPHEHHRFIGEGDARALAPVVRLLEADGNKFGRLSAGGKLRVNAAVLQLQAECLPMFARTVETLRDSGLAPDAAITLAEKCFSHALRLYARNGRRVWDSRDPQPAIAGTDARSTSSAGPDLMALEDALVRDWAPRPIRAAAAVAGNSGPEKG